ncbi:hypothetical protein D3C81_889200 [compost metagenome]
MHSVLGRSFRLVQRQRPHQLIQPERLEQAVVHADRKAALPFALQRIGGQADEPARRPAVASLMQADRPGQGMAVQARHVAVTDHHINVFFEPQPQGLGTVFGDPCLVPQVLQLLRQQQAIGRVIIDHQHPQAHARRSHLRRWQRLPLVSGGRAREVEQDLHPCALPQHTVQRHPPAHHLAQAAADAQAQPGAAARRLTLVTGLAKRLAKPGQLGLGDADAGVLDL